MSTPATHTVVQGYDHEHGPVTEHGTIRSLYAMELNERMRDDDYDEPECGDSESGFTMEGEPL